MPMPPIATDAARTAIGGRTRPGWPKGRRLHALCATLLAALCVVSCGPADAPATDAAGLPTGPVHRADLLKHREATLFFPSSLQVSPFGADQSTEFGVSTIDPAFTGAVLRADAPPARVLAWYHAWLLAHGWRPWSGYGISGDWTDSAGYARGTREDLVVGIEDPKLIAGTLGHRIPPAPTVYEIRYTIEAYGHTQPR